MKVAIKLQGTPQVLPTDAFSELKGQLSKLIVLGADVTHAGAGATPGTPSIAAVVGSKTDKLAGFLASMRLQPAKQEVSRKSFINILSRWLRSLERW